MEDEVMLEHQVNYRTKIKSYGTAAMISAAIAAISGYLVFRAHELNSTSLTFFLLSAAFLIAFLTALAIILLRSGKFGSFEEIDVIGRKILYRSEKNGTRIFDASNIENIVIGKYSSHDVSDDQYYVIISAKDSTTPFRLPNTVSNYGELVRKIRAFKEENFCSEHPVI